MSYLFSVLNLDVLIKGPRSKKYVHFETFIPKYDFFLAKNLWDKKCKINFNQSFLIIYFILGSSNLMGKFWFEESLSGIKIFLAIAHLEIDGSFRWADELDRPVRPRQLQSFLNHHALGRTGD